MPQIRLAILTPDMILDVNPCQWILRKLAGPGLP